MSDTRDTHTEWTEATARQEALEKQVKSWAPKQQPVRRAMPWDPIVKKPWWKFWS